MKNLFNKTMLLLAAVSTLGLSAQAETIAVTYVNAPTGVNDGADYVLPYQLTVGGISTDATCYDVFDNVTGGQEWTANELTLAEAASTGQFRGDSNALAGYEEVGFLSQQTTSSPQNQIDLQHDIWNVFAPGRYSVTAGMQRYLDLLTTPSYADFDFDSLLFLEDVNQANPAQAFVIDPPAAAPEPGTIALLSAGVVLIGVAKIKKVRLAS